MLYENLTDDQKAKAKACKTPEDILALAKQEGYELSDEELELETRERNAKLMAAGIENTVVADPKDVAELKGELAEMKEMLSAFLGTKTKEK